MEEREETGSDAVAGDTTRNSEPSFAKSESPNPVVTSITGINMNLTAPAMKKRGRPRKYAPDGSLAMPLNPMPISASVPVGNFGTTKKARARLSAVKKHLQRSETESLGETIECSGGVNFTPHILTVVTGEDVTMKVLSFSQQGPQAICILSANGAVSSATLRQPDTFGGTLTYEGRFEILSLSGSFMPIESVGTRSRSGGMSVSLAGPDGRVVGGGVAGLLIAAGPVQVVIGSFVLNNHLELKIKKRDTISTPNPASGSGPSATYSAAPQRPNVASPSRDDNISTSHPNSITDINISPSGS